MILYWNVGKFREPLVQHLVERDEETIDGLKKMVSGLRASLQGGPYPARICSSIDCKRAEACQLAKLCFQEDA